MRYIELFSGSGGGILAHSVLHGHRLVAAAEWLHYGREVLTRRQADGVLPRFNMYNDVQEMDGSRYTGVDMLAGGFPCQGLSLAGRKKWLDDPRSALVWHMLRIAAEAQPRYIFAENSPNLRTKGLHLIVPELQRMGYSRIAWCVVGANDLGAYHQRNRMWLLAKRGGPPFIHKWGDPEKTPACGLLVGNTLTALKKDILGISGVSVRNTLPTLICSDARASGNRPDPTLWSLSDRLGLTNKAGRLKRLPTLTASDYRGAWEGEGLERQLAKRSKPLRDMLPYIIGGVGKVINPQWAEWFMGWPVEWTNIEAHITQAHLNRWRTKVLSDRYWEPAVEKTVLPATLPSSRDADHQKNRIIALGNGQVPVVAATVFDALKGLLG